MLKGALESLLCQETDGQFTYDIVVIDNASTDDTKQVVEQMAATASAPIRYVYQATPGPAPARNRGLEHSRGEWLAFIDDDELATPGWLKHLHQAAVTTGASIIGGAVHLDLPQDVLSRFNRFVRATSLREIDYYPVVQPYRDKRLPGTCNALVARRVFDEVGCFDAMQKCGGSDSDFFLRARAAGFDLFYTPHAIVRHRVAPNRLTTEYFRWDAQQGCSAFAGLDCKFKGRLALGTLCTARIAHALMVVLPRLTWGWLKNDPQEILGQRVRLWRTEGYVRGTLVNLAPALFPQRRYFADLEFRRGRIVGQQSMEAA